MKNLIKSLVVGLLLLILFPSCKTYRNVENLKPSIPLAQRTEVFDITSLEKLIEGDRIIIQSKNNKLYHAYFKLVQGEMLMGTLWKEDSKKLYSPQAFQLQLSKIEHLKVLRVSAAATIPVVIISAMGILVGIVVIAWSSGGGFGW
jgi:hypothetical protein